MVTGLADASSVAALLSPPAVLFHVAVTISPILKAPPNPVAPLMLIFASDTVGAVLLPLTVMVAVAVPPPRPASVLLSDARMVKLALPTKFVAGVNFRPALPCAKVMNALLAIAVVPLF